MSGKLSEAVNVSSPGSQLCKARERAGFSLQAVAEQTLIPIVKLQALERDDYFAVGGTAHITGYARAYGRVLGIDVSSIVQEIEVALGVEQTRVDTENLLGLTYSSSKSPFIYVLIVTVIVLLIGLWVGLKFFSGSDKIANETTIKPLSDNTLDMSAPQSQVMTVSESSSRDEQNVAPPVSVVADELGAMSNERQTVAMDDPDMSADPVPAKNAVAGLSVSSSHDQLQLSFVADCWLNVSDASGKTLISNLAKAGATIEVNGVAPFQVHLGNASAASKIALNKDVVPFSPEPGQRTLRLTIGG